MSDTLAIKIIEDSLHDLKEIYFLHRTEEEIFLYLEVLIAYFEGDVDTIYKVSKHENISEVVFNLSLLRASVVKQQVDIDLLNILEKKVKLLDSTFWKAETYFVIAWSFRELGSYHNGAVYFQKAYKALWNIGAKKKAVKSLLNHVVCQTHLDSSKRYLNDFQYLHKKAIEVQDPIVQGLCELNMGREYRILKSYDLAQTYIYNSVELLEGDRGNNNYYFAILERALLNLELKRFKQAHLDYQVVQESSLPEIQEAAKVLLVKIGSRETINKNMLDPVWVDVLENKQIKNLKLTQMEAQLIEYLSVCEKRKEDIIFYLYGDKLNIESAENRFKVLLSRLRKKAPNLISYFQGYYTLSEGSTSKIHVS